MMDWFRRHLRREFRDYITFDEIRLYPWQRDFIERMRRAYDEALHQRVKEKTMTMENYDVSFSIPSHRFGSLETDCRVKKYAAVLEDAFDIDECELRRMLRHDRVAIVCRADQFAVFMILRNDAGVCNMFQELKPRLVPSPKRGTSSPLDVTNRCICRTSRR